MQPTTLSNGMEGSIKTILSSNSVIETNLQLIHNEEN